MRSGLGNHDLASLMDIQALYRRLSVELPPVERVPRRGTPHPCRGGAGGGVSIYLTDAVVFPATFIYFYAFFPMKFSNSLRSPIHF